MALCNPNICFNLTLLYLTSTGFTSGRKQVATTFVKYYVSSFFFHLHLLLSSGNVNSRSVFSAVCVTKLLFSKTRSSILVQKHKSALGLATNMIMILKKMCPCHIFSASSPPLRSSSCEKRRNLIAKRTYSNTHINTWKEVFAYTVISDHIVSQIWVLICIFICISWCAHPKSAVNIQIQA